MLDLLHTQPQVSDAEAREAIRRELEEVQIAFVAIRGSAAADAPAPDEAAVKQALEQRAEELRARYEERSGVYNVPEKVHARHVLFAVPSDADEAKTEAVHKEAEAALAALRAGGDFDALARERSDDPGSKASGGDLGFFPRGQMVPAFEQAAFALKPGQLSGVVTTQFGYHVIKMIEIKPGRVVPFDEASPKIKQFLEGQKKQQHADGFIDGLKKKSKIEILI